MVINESAYYKGKLWCAYELKDHHGNYKEELRLNMRKESQNYMFTCPDCGEHLILCAGPIMEPFFKHHENTKCIINRKEVNRRNIVARRMLYHLARDSFPEAAIEVGKKLAQGIDPDVWIPIGEKVLVFEYLSYEVKLAAWEEKHQYYKDHGIVDVWFLNYKKYQYEVKTTFEYMVSKYVNVLKFIDYESAEIILKEKCELADKTIFVTKAYPIEEIRIDETGEAICDYQEYKQEKIALLLYEEKIERLKRKEEAARRNHIADRQDRKLTKENEQQTIFLPKKTILQSDLSQVKRDPIGSVKEKPYTVNMTSLKEIWELPALTGSLSQIQAGIRKRVQYLKRINRELGDLPEGEERDNRVRYTIRFLEFCKDAQSWL